MSFNDFKTAFAGDIITPDSPEYNKSIERWAANASRRAKFVCFVKGPEDVALAIKYARSEGLPLAIRGGGHNPAGSSSAEDGLVIDLSRHLNGCRVDPETKRAYVGGGAVWEAVDVAAIKHGLAGVAGTVNHVSLSIVAGHAE